jgi:hypothetical protein
MTCITAARSAACAICIVRSKGAEAKDNSEIELGANMLQLHTFGGLRIERDGQAFQLSTYKARLGSLPDRLLSALAPSSRRGGHFMARLDQGQDPLHLLGRQLLGDCRDWQ